MKRLFDFLFVLGLCALVHLVYMGCQSGGGGLQADSPELLARVDALESQSATAQQDVTALQAALTALQSDLSPRIDALESQSTTAQEDITALQGALTALSPRLDALEAASRDVSVRVFRGMDQDIPAGATPTALAFDQERWDTDNCHETAGQTTRLTVRTAGNYFLFANIRGENVAWQLSIRRNGTEIIAQSTSGPTTTLGPMLSIATSYSLQVDDYVEVLVRHNGGTGLFINATPNFSPEFGMARIPFAL